MIDTVLRYRRLGLTVVPTHTIRDGKCTCPWQPCASPAKHPAVRWIEFQTRRPSILQQVRWSEDYPDYNIGFIHGAANGTVVFDLDGQDFMANLAALEREYGPLPITPTVISGSGGCHQIFRHPGVYVPTVKKIKPGLDIRGDGGFSVAPPSVHECGRRYEWDVDAHIEDVPLADLPPAWVELIHASQIDKTTTEPKILLQTPNGEVILDGREGFMRDTILATLRDLIKQLDRPPTHTELTDASWQRYAPNVDLSRPGRGFAELHNKCAITLHRFRAGRIDMPLTTPPTF